MGIGLQIAIPLFTTFAALAVIALLRRYWKPETFVVGLVALGLAVSATVGLAAGQPTQDATGTKKLRDTTNFSLALAKKYMLDGRYDAAQDILDSLGRTGGSNKAIRLTAARKALLMGDYITAVQLYQQVEDAQPEKELAVNLLDSTRPKDDAFISYLESQGKSPDDYGLVTVLPNVPEQEVALESVRDSLQQELDDYCQQEGKDTADALDNVAQLDQAFDQYLETGSDVDKTVVEELLKDLAQNAKDEPELNTNLHFRVTRVEGYVLTGEFKQIAQKADQYTTTEELVILAQLMSSGLVGRKDFSDSFVQRNTERYEAVLEACKDALEANKDSLPSNQYNKLKDQVNNLRTAVKDPVSFALQQQLLQQALTGDAAMRSKCYLALAKIKNAAGDKEMTETYITAALGSAADSDDRNYQQAMEKMTQIIQGSSEASEIMHVAEYVDVALNHSLPLDIPQDMITSDAPVEDTLGQQMTETVNTSTATINIGVIDKDSFPVVKARVQIQSQQWTTLEELKAHLKVYDCGSQITDFTLEPLTFQRSRIILLCDCSGSMSGSEETLRQVIRDFAATMGEGEEVSVVGFASSIRFIKEFSGDKDTVASYADEIYASGGTALFNSLLEVGQLHTQDINSNNIIIAMTDGQDGNSGGEGDMYNKIGAMAAEKGLTVYTVGLGDVDADYLQLMAQCGNGSFLYAKNKEELQSFYSFIHGQLNNQYILTYTAKNQTRNERTLELSVDSELGSAVKTYYLQDPQHTNEGSDSYDPYTIEDTDITVSGLTTKLLYQSSKSQTVLLKGTGFDAGDDITVRITGNIKYNLEAKFVDSETYEITVPSSVATGSYDLEVSVAESAVTLKKELSVVEAGGTRNFRFGSYHFTCQDSYVNDDGATVLSGNVTMNGWLRFKGDISIRDGYEGSDKAWITDENGFYVTYAEDNSQGLAHYLAEKGVPVSFGAIGTFYIRPDPYTAEGYKDFDVDTPDYYGELNLLMLTCNSFEVSFYPDMLKFQGINFNTELPFQEQLLRGMKLEDMYDTKVDSHCLLGATQIALLAELKYKNISTEFKEDFVMVSLPLRLNELTLEVDTLKNDYSLKADVGLKSLTDDPKGFELTFGIVGGKFDALGLRINGPKIQIVTNPVPVHMGNFGFLIEGMSKETDDGNLLTKILSKDITIEFDVTVADMKELLPKIDKLLDTDKKVVLGELKDCKLKLQLREFRICFDAKMVLLDTVELGEVNVTAGKFSYTNALIGFYNETEYGLRVAVKKDAVNMHTPNLDIDITGQAEVCLGYPYSGLWINGKADFEVGWGILSADFDVAGDFLIGAYKNNLGNLQLSVILRGTGNSGNHVGFHAYVTRPSGFDVYTY